MESDPVDTFFMTVKNVFNFYLGAADNFLRPASLLLHRKLLEFEEVPDPNGLIETAACYQSVLWMELCTHDIVRVAC